MLITAVWTVAYVNINTAYVQIPALRDTLAEEHVTKILKCFTISAALCIYIYIYAINLNRSNLKYDVAFD